jgi:Oxidoreductase family, NAD-binding Rossmann fold
MQTRSFGIGILGTGILGRRMMGVLQQHPRSSVAAVWDPTPSALQAALAHALEARPASDTDSLVHDSAIDEVYVASPPAWHASAASRVLQDGKACFCERPLTHDIADAEALHDTVALSRLPFAVNLPFARGTASRRMQQSEVLSHSAVQALRLFGPFTVAGVELQRPPGQAETALRARWIHRDLQVVVDAAVAGEIADDNRFEVMSGRGSVALTGWSRLADQDQTSEPLDNTAQTLDGLAALLADQADHGLAMVNEAASVVRGVESMLAP